MSPERGAPPAGRAASPDLRAGRGVDRGASAWRALGLILIVLPLVPLGALFGRFAGAERLVSPLEWVSGAAIVLVAAWLLSLPELPGRLATGGRALAGGAAAGWMVGVGLAATAVLSGWVSGALFHHGPLLVDSIVQLFQARTLAAGSLTAAAPSDPAAFVIQNLLIEGGRWYGQYPPGYPALLAPGVLAGVPWLVPVVLSTATAGALYAFVRRAFDATTALLTLLLLLLCPFFWFMGASFMSHVPMLCLVALFLWAFAAWEDEGGAARAVVAGALLGAAALVRPFTALAVAVPFAAFSVGPVVRSERARRDVVAGLVAFVLVGSLYLAYNAATTGAALRPGYLQLWGPSHGPGFHRTPYGTRHTVLSGIRNELADLQLLAVRLFEWPLPALWPVGGALAAGWLRRRWDRRLALAFLALPAAYLFYWHRDSFLGPRFLYAGVAFILPLTARALIEGGRRLREASLQPGGLFRPVTGSRWLASAAVLCLAWSLLVGAPGRLRSYRGEYRSMIDRLPERARAAGIEPALVFVKVDAGNRLLARLRGLGAGAGDVERAYRSVDFCELVGVERRARSEAWTGARLDRELGSLMGRGEVLVRVPGLNGDASLRLRRERLRPRPVLTPECADEIRYDQDGYGVYTPHFLDNRLDLSGPLVVARDLREGNVRLRARYPDRAAYLYHDGRFSRLPPMGGRRARAEGASPPP